MASVHPPRPPSSRPSRRQLLICRDALGRGGGTAVDGTAGRGGEATMTVPGVLGQGLEVQVGVALHLFLL